MGIRHLEDLDPDDILKVLADFAICEIQEKLDGVHLRAGRDATGRFYTSREGKGGRRYWSADDYPDEFWSSDFKSAHLALEHWPGLAAGQEVDLELLRGGQANTVEYDEIRRAVITRGRTGKLPVRLEARLTAPSTRNGLTIQRQIRREYWTVCGLPLVDPDSDVVPWGKVGDFRRWLYKIVGPGMSVREVLRVRLSHEPQAHRDGLKVLRDQVRVETAARLASIKEDLVDRMVRPAVSAFGAAWIEGFVIRHPDGIVTKLVDRELFTAANAFLWKFRDDIARVLNGKSPKRSDLVAIYQQYHRVRPELRLICRGREIRYGDAVHQRTLEAFAAAFARVI